MLHPGLMVYMLLFPVILFFALPGLLLPLVRLAKKLTASGFHQATAEKNIMDRKYSPAAEHREWARQRFDGVIAHVSDGVHCSRVAVKNISEHGICFTCPPDRLNEDTDRLAVLLTGAGKSFQLQVKPQWKEQLGTEQSIGATIVDSLGRWDEFAGITGHTHQTRAV